MATETTYVLSNSNTLWGVNDYTKLQTSTGSIASCIEASSADDAEQQRYNWNLPSLVNVTNIDLNWEALCEEGGSWDVTLGVSLFVNGVETAQQFVTVTNNDEDGDPFQSITTSFTGSWSSITSLEVAWEAEADMASRETVWIDYAECEFTGDEASSGETYNETGDGGAVGGGSVLQAPNEVTGLTVTAYSSSQLSLSWAAPTDTNGLTISHYIIGRSIEGGAWAYDTTNDNSTTYVDGGQPPNRLHEYRVAAVTAAGQGLWSTTEGDTTFPYTEEGSGGAVAGGSAYVTSCGPLVIGCDHFTGAYVDFDNHYIDQLVGSNSEQWNVNTSTDDWLIEDNQLKVDETGATYLYADLQQADLYCVLTYTIASGSADNFQGIIFRWADADNYLRVGYNPYLQKLQFWKHINGSDELMASQTVVASGTVTLEVNASGVELTASINGGSPLVADTVFNQAETNVGVYNWKDNSGTLDPVYFDEIKFFDARMLEYGSGGSVGSGSAIITVDSSPTTTVTGSSLVAAEGTVTHIPVTYDETASGGVSGGSTATFNALKQPTVAIAPASSLVVSPSVTPNTSETITGTSSISVLPAVVAGVSTSISGESAVSAIPTVGSDLNIAVTATSSVTSTPTVTPDNSVAITSTSSLTANPAVSGDITATIAAVSSLSVTKTRVVSVESAISATSSLTITPTAVVGPSPAITATSLLAGTGAVVGNETAAITGTSSISALPASIAGVSSTITGTSSISSTATMVVLGEGSVDAVSSLTIVPTVTADMTGDITGTSALTALPAVSGGINSTITGTSAISALPRVKPVVSSTISAISSISSTAMLVLQPEGSIAGTSSLASVPTVLPIVTASIDAISALTAVGGYRPKSIVQELGDYLQATSAITDIASNIYLGYLPESVTLPAIVYTRTRNIHINQLDGLAGVMEASIVVELYSYSYLTNRNLMKAMRDSLSFYDDLMGSVMIDSIDFGEPVDSIEKMKEGSNQAVYKTTINLTVYHNENVAELV